MPTFKSAGELRLEVKWLLAAVVVTALLAIAFYPAFSLGFSEAQGPVKNWLQAADLNGDTDLELFTAGNGGQYQVWWNDRRGNFSAGQNGTRQTSPVPRTMRGEFLAGNGWRDTPLG